jgi:4-amino-4-deoxy-L-arabinose transferase-like glycosyltransferase
MPWMLLALIGAGSVLRIARLGSLPPALFRDEAEKAYNAWAILSTGRDLSGDFLPLFIKVFGVTTSAVYQYAAIPFVWLLGLNEWSARLPAALAGVATIAVTHAWISRERGRDAALWTTLFLALSPWHIVFSRWAQQGIFLPLLLASAMLGWQLFLKGRRIGLPFAGIMLALTIYTYDVARLFVPMLMLAAGVIYFGELRKRWRETLVAGLVFLVFAMPTLILLLARTEDAQARFRAISIFQEGASAGPVILRFLANYFNHFSPSFLLFDGDPELRHSAGIGVLTGAECLALGAGILCALYHRRRQDLLLLSWLLLFPVAASLTREGIPHALRCIVAIPAIQAIAGIGLEWIAVNIRRNRCKAFRQAYVFLSILAFLPFAHLYFVRYAARSAFHWQYGVKQALELVRPEMDKIDRVVLYNIVGGDFLVAFYDHIPPRDLQPGTRQPHKFAFTPFNYPLSALYEQSTGATAFITLPLYEGPPNGRAIPIRAPGSDEVVAVVYLNDTLLQRIQPGDKSAAN